MSTQILVIEDDAQIRENIADLLTLSGYVVQTAGNGREGISQAMLSPPDLVLCDIMMPEVDGYQVLDVIRENRSLATLPFIFLTAKSDSTDIRRGMVQGADDYLTKPFTIESLLQAIAGRLQREAQRKAQLQVKLEAQRKTLSSVSSHEYNTPLSGIIGFADLLLTDYPYLNQEEMVSMLEMIKLSGIRLRRTLDNVRLIEVLQQLTPLHPLYVYFSTGQASITEEVVAQQLQSVEYRLDQELDCWLTVESAQLRLSEENLKLILVELLDNAIKFSDRSQSVTITGQREATRYKLTVVSQGRPFTAQEIAQIGPYKQFGRDYHEQQGLGLGLALVKKTLEINEGWLEIESSPAGKTTVMVWIPL